MRPRRPRLRYLLVSIGLIAFGIAGSVFDFLVLPTIVWVFFCGVVCLVHAVLIYRVDFLLYRAELAKYRGHQDTSSAEEEPTP
jgi:hypothetical protein